MGQVYDYLGLSVGVVTSTGAYIYDPSHVPNGRRRRRARRARARSKSSMITCARSGSAKRMPPTSPTRPITSSASITCATTPRTILRRSCSAATTTPSSTSRLHLIDEARTPLIISGPAGDAPSSSMSDSRHRRGFQKGGLHGRREAEGDPDHREGITKAEEALGIENLYTEGGMKYAHHLETAVRAKALFHKDKEYVVKDGEIVIVDEFTGRMQPGRRWSEGLHQAIEAKEGVAGPRGDPHLRERHVPELFPHVREARGHDRYRALFRRGVLYRVRPRCGRRADQ
jgi:preprotein translocase subunit SecA